MSNITEFQNLDLSNAFLFSTIAQDAESCQMIVQMALSRKIPKVKVHTEHAVLYSSDYKSIRLDVYGTDELDVFYDIEAQNQNEGNLPKRSRYYQAKLDVASLKPGQDFNDLKPLYIIFICTFDPFGKGFYRYTFEPRCKEKPDMILEDETCRIFLNTKGKNDKNVPKELVDFLHYMENSTDQFVESTQTEPTVKKLHEKVKQVKSNANLEAKYMTVGEWIQIQGRQEHKKGHAEGLAVGLNVARKGILEVLAARGTVSDSLKDQISAETNPEKLDTWFKIAVLVKTPQEFENQIGAE